MPEISRFLGIVIGMFFREHGVPHFHAVCGEYKITVEIESRKVRGEFPARAQRLVLEWSELHTQELLDNWERAGQRQPLQHIAPFSVTAMDYDVVEARYLGGYTVWLRFRDGTFGEIDLERELHGPAFEPLCDPAVFSRFQIHPEFHTLTWTTGADFAPEFLHDNVAVTA